MSSNVITAEDKKRLKKKLAALRKMRTDLKRAEEAMTFSDHHLESELEDIEEEIWELEQSLE